MSKYNESSAQSLNRTVDKWFLKCSLKLCLSNKKYSEWVVKVFRIKVWVIHLQMCFLLAGLCWQGLTWSLFLVPGASFHHKKQFPLSAFFRLLDPFWFELRADTKIGTSRAGAGTTQWEAVSPLPQLWQPLASSCISLGQAVHKVSRQLLEHRKSSLEIAGVGIIYFGVHNCPFWPYNLRN